MSTKESTAPKVQKKEDSSAEKNEEMSLKGFEATGVNVQNLTLEMLFKAGVYFGHKRSRRNPKMDDFVYVYRQGVAIIDLKKTIDCLKQATEFLEGVARAGKPIVFVGTKKHVRTIIQQAARECAMPFVDNRWLGGTFTNFETISGRVKHLVELEGRLDNDEFTGYTKLEKLKKREEANKLDEKLGGLREMNDVPGALVVMDVKQDHLAIREARRRNIPVVALVDTNDDPKGVAYVVPANNDALSSVRLLLECLVSSVKKGKEEALKAQASNEEGK